MGRLPPIFVGRLWILVALGAAIMVGSTGWGASNTETSMVPFAGITDVAVTAQSQGSLHLAFESDLPVQYRLTRPAPDQIEVTLLNARLLNGLFDSKHCQLIQGDPIGRTLCLSPKSTATQTVLVIQDKTLLQTLVTVSGATMAGFQPVDLGTTQPSPVFTKEPIASTALVQNGSVKNPGTIASNALSTMPPSTLETTPNAFDMTSPALAPLSPPEPMVYRAESTIPIATGNQGIRFTVLGSDKTYTTGGPQYNAQQMPSSPSSYVDEPLTTLALAPSLAIDPVVSVTSPQTVVTEAKILYQQGNRHEALALLAKYVAQHHTEVVPAALLGELYIENNQYAEAVNTYEALLDTKPSASVIQLVAPRYATALLYQSNRSEAQRIQRLVSLLHNNKAALAQDDWVPFVLGVLYQAEGNYSASLPLLQQSVRLNPRAVDGQTHLALTYEKLGNVAQAKEHDRLARQLNPKSPTVKDTLAALEQRLATSGH